MSAGLIFEFWCSPQNPLTKNKDTAIRYFVKWNAHYVYLYTFYYGRTGPCYCDKETFIHSFSIDQSIIESINQKGRKERLPLSIYCLPGLEAQSCTLYSYHTDKLDLICFYSKFRNSNVHRTHPKESNWRYTAPFLLDVTRTYNTTTEFDFILLYKIKHPGTYYVLISMSIAR